MRLEKELQQLTACIRNLRASWSRAARLGHEMPPSSHFSPSKRTCAARELTMGPVHTLH